MKANEILMISRNADDGMARAEAEAVEVTQNWDSESTLYEFDDGSALLISGPQMNAFKTADEAMSA